MTRICFRFGGRKVVAVATAAVFAGILHSPGTVRAQQPKQNPNFTGTVTRITENSQAAIVKFRFEAGARTKWHSHDGGQIILVEDGVCRTQVRGGPVVELHAGETTYAPPGVAHWHGAAPDQACTQFNVTRGGVQWLDEVTEKEYTAAVKK
jgi:quercetin dioxygenase-like cupin family protein